MTTTAVVNNAPILSNGVLENGTIFTVNVPFMDVATFTRKCGSETNANALLQDMQSKLSANRFKVVYEKQIADGDNHMTATTKAQAAALKASIVSKRRIRDIVAASQKNQLIVLLKAGKLEEAAQLAKSF